MEEMSRRYGLKAANVFHAGDGNLHPLILYDANKPGELVRAEAFGHDILRLRRASAAPCNPRGSHSPYQSLRL